MKRLKILEKDIKRQVKDYLNILQRTGKLFYFYNLQGLGSYKGIPDFTVLCPQGKTIWVEVKTLTGKLSPGQIAFREQCIRLGHKFVCVFGWEDLKNNIDAIQKGD